jgi:hypothetical protein
MAEFPLSLVPKPISRHPLGLRQGRLPVMVVIALTILVAWVHLNHKEAITAKKKVVIIETTLGIGRRVGPLLPLPLQGARRHLQQLRPLRF